MVALSLLEEFTKLGKQHCPFCSGWGHAGDDCPTDAKLAPLRLGTTAQRSLMTDLRAACRAKYKPANDVVYSMLQINAASSARKRKREAMAHDILDLTF